MMFHLVAVGRVRDEAVRTACEAYLHRFRRFAACEVLEVADRARGRDADAVRRTEGAALLNAVPSAARAVAITRDGAAYDSRAFAARVAWWREQARDVAWVIGGAFGLADEVVTRCDERLSLSALTLPHDLARLVLLEQLYRAGTILRGEPYHKGA